MWAAPTGDTPDAPLLDDIDFTDIERVTVPSGTYDVYVTDSAATDVSSPLVSATGVDVTADAVTVVAHQDAGGDATLSAFVDDLSAPASGTLNLFVRHAAAAPPADVEIGATTEASGVANGQEAGVRGVEAGVATPVQVVAGGTPLHRTGPGEGLIFPADVVLFIYAVGNADDGYQLLFDERQPAPGATPTAVPAGRDGSGTPVAPWPALVVLAAGGLLVLGSAARVAVSARR